MRFFHQYDQHGNHRLGVSRKTPGDLTQDGLIKWGKWFYYQQPAVLKRRHQWLLAVTPYFDGSLEFPDSNKLYAVKYHAYPLEKFEQAERK